MIVQPPRAGSLTQHAFLLCSGLSLMSAPKKHRRGDSDSDIVDEAVVLAAVQKHPRKKRRQQRGQQQGAGQIIQQDLEFEHGHSVAGAIPMSIADALGDELGSSAAAARPDSEAAHAARPEEPVPVQDLASQAAHPVAPLTGNLVSNELWGPSSPLNNGESRLRPQIPSLTGFHR